MPETATNGEIAPRVPAGVIKAKKALTATVQA